MLLLITIWLMARELACSGQLVKCGAKSQTGEKNKGGPGGEGDRDPMFSLLTPPTSLVFLLASFAPSPQSELLEQAIRGHVCWVLSYMFPDQNRA